MSELPVSPSFPFSGLTGTPPSTPQEFCDEPQFICEDMTRTDVCQGSLGETPGPILSTGLQTTAPLTCPPSPPLCVSSVLSWLT